MKPIKLFISSIFIALLFSSCENDLPNGGIPAYIQINKAEIKTTSSQGTTSNNITDVWVEAEGTNIGIYELPLTMPVLSNGPTRMIFQAGIKDNGIAATRTTYPFYLPIDTILDLTELETIQFSPKFKLSSFTDIPLNEDFELGNAFSNMARIINDPNVFEGTACGVIQLDVVTPSAEAELINPLELPRGKEVYIELDYKSEATFRLVVESRKTLETIKFEKLFILPKEDWNKIYINLTNDVASLDADEYIFLIRADLPDTLSKATIYIDNFRILHF